MNQESTKNHQGYMTSQKRGILEFLRNHPDRQFTTEEICQAVNTPKMAAGEMFCASRAGLSTVYRQLGNLFEEGLLRRYPTEHGFVYQYSGNNGSCNHHFHLFCIRCGTVSHLECQMSHELIRHIEEEHGFMIDSGKSVIYGICQKCQRREDRA